MDDVAFRYCPECAHALVQRDISHVMRSVCPSCGYIAFRGPQLVTIAIVQYQNTVLLGRRSIDPGKGAWSFFGGYVEQGETVEDATLREVKEETGLDVHLGTIVGLYSVPGDNHVLVVYRAYVHESDVLDALSRSEETSEMALFDWETLPELAFAIDTQILRDWRGTQAERGCCTSGMHPEK